ncbi:MAG: YggS family pyridoxal phosphate-dependent enzyme [Planctomycetes bacterium]|nr:YggS family pyridoxal phosphate-dependent enzyme [Planctomycetota bacterium]MBI3844487.1 YggS family pyridoxal phosphate-dependent enzyme [Planctomycetota bacterium]
MAGRLRSVRERIDAAAARAGRARGSARLLAVTKTVDAPMIDALAGLGVADVGENRVLDALRKSSEVRSPLRWHLIGHLQTNKVKKALDLITTIHSIDSLRLARAVAHEANGRGLRIPVFFEVNVSGEATKGGFTPDSLRTEFPDLVALPAIEPRGLMTMAPLGREAEASRPVFRALRELRDALARVTPLPELSMGMSGDFEVAVEEGSTCVRVGTALFEPVGEAEPRGSAR